MTILECLNQLPDDMEMLDRSEIERDKIIKTVAQIKSELGNHSNETGYEIREVKSNYGRTTKQSIGQPGRINLYIEC